MMRDLGLHTLSHHLVLGKSLTHISTHLVCFPVFESLSSPHVLRGLMFQELLVINEPFGLCCAHRLCHSTLYLIR
jgi:hypothetical protein